MPFPVTRTKVVLPRRRMEILTRQRLLDFLYNLVDYKLIILTAPAGYGKTSLLVDFAHKTDLPVCWYSLDTLDLEPQRFFAHFIAALAVRFPDFGAQSLAFLEASIQTTPDIDGLVSTVVNDAYEHIREHFLVVLDDYHLVNDNKEIDLFINRFAQEVNENCHLILSSRILLTLPDLPLMVARSQVAGLSFEELAFRSEEIQMLMLQNNGITISQTAAEELAKETEGWITGLLLSTQTMWQGMVDRLRLARVSGVGLYDYLAQQVLDQQSPQVRDFLLRTSFLEEFDVGLCEQVFGSSQDWSKILETLLQNNLFVLPVGEDGRWVRFHHLFRDFLQSRFERELPDQKEALLQRICEVYGERRDWEKAYATCLRISDIHTTIHLIEKAGSHLISHGRMILLNEWLNRIPFESLSTSPELLSVLGVVNASLGKVDQGLVLLNQAVLAQRSIGNFPKLALSLVRRATAFRFQGKYQESYDDALEALGLAKQDPGLRVQKAEALRTLGINLYYMGRLNDAIERYLQSLGIYEALGDQQNIAMLWMELGLVYMNTGLYKRAMGYYQQSLDFWRKTGNILRVATLYNNLAVLNHLTGEYAKAAALYEEGLVYARQSKHLRTEAYILSGIGDLYADLQAFQPASEAYHKARELARQIDYRFLLIYVDLAEAALFRRNGDVAQARSLLKTAESTVKGGNSEFEQALYSLEAGHLILIEGDTKEAIQRLEAAARTFDEGGHRVEAARANLSLAAAIMKGGNIDTAIACMKNAFDIAENIDSPHVLVVAGQEAVTLLEAASAEPHLIQEAANLLKQVKAFQQNVPIIRRRLRPHVAAVPFAPPKLTIQALGKTQVELDGQPVTVAEWQGQKKVREFFFYLLIHHHGLTKEEIGVTFWPESSPGQLKLQFKNTIYRVRYALGQDVVLLNEDSYQFNHDLDYEYDVESFAGKVEKARAASSLDEKMSFLREAVGIYKGPYLVEIDSPWALVEREHLWQMNIDATLELARISLETGSYNASLEYCHNILAEDMCLEEAHRLAMRAYAAKGNRAGVKRQYESCKQALLMEIQSAPSSQTIALYETLRV